jgi:hypothetical protein
MHVRMVVSRFREALLSAYEVLAVFLELFCGMLIVFFSVLKEGLRKHGGRYCLGQSDAQHFCSVRAPGHICHVWVLE